MLPFEFRVLGPPLSHQARDRAKLRMWRAEVGQAAEGRWPAGTPPLDQALKITVVYYHDGDTVRIDNDNLLKPIQDALIGLVYKDDRLLVHVEVRKERLDGLFLVRGMSLVLAEGFSRGEAFIYVRIEDAPYQGTARAPYRGAYDE